jgi:hypothetical protein
MSITSKFDQAAVFGLTYSLPSQTDPCGPPDSAGHERHCGAPAIHPEFGNFNFTADQEIDCLADGCRLNPKISGLVTVNIDRSSGFPVFERCVDVDDSGEFRIIPDDLRI